MDLEAVRVELVTVVDAIPGLRAYAWAPGVVSPPAAFPLLPDMINYGQTYGRGKTHIPDLPLVVVVGRASERAASKLIAAYAAESGPSSVPAAIEAREGMWTSCDTVTVTSCGFPTVSIAAVEYLAAEFHLNIVGKGAGA